jgi:hypothetical protein
MLRESEIISDIPKGTIIDRLELALRDKALNVVQS